MGKFRERSVRKDRLQDVLICIDIRRLRLEICQVLYDAKHVGVWLDIDQAHVEAVKPRFPANCRVQIFATRPLSTQRSAPQTPAPPPTLPSSAGQQLNTAYKPEYIAAAAASSCCNWVMCATNTPSCANGDFTQRSGTASASGSFAKRDAN